MKSYISYFLFYLFLLAGSCKNLVHISDSSDTRTASSSTAGNMGKINVQIATDVPPSVGENSNMYLGNPSNAQPSFIFKNNYLINLEYYIMSYDADRGIPNWVSWHLNSDRLINNTKRSNKFVEYTGLPESWYQVQHRSYTASGFDRGHHCPSADRLTSEQANASTFLMINMLPQAPNNNQRVWNNFEMYLRKRVNEGNEIYIIMGSYGQGGVGNEGYALSIDDGRVAVPSHIWKIAIILPEGTNDLDRIEAGEAEIIAITTPNENSVRSSWKNYIVSIRAIEDATGYNFLSELSIPMQNELELQSDQAA
ncbi:DNA/RNA non-specific endonuclease [Sphingobacterium sp. lm-10]|uniref:DNA/RNA non-specific endonuclease n=1 Tax=Sphingobacterium sp. lm-10 TaxID=2944904 RepID=UPI00202246CA|nr:DNA/RNA non-specific endonuclease [Sphingobacterium sp. lm-10]MCL7987322.1 DNA/RNA non-specific endonuclease [Sphingobacterium sp. lm-10]